MPVHVGVGQPAAQARHGRVVGERVAVGAEQRPPGLPFGAEPGRSHVPGAEVDVAAFEPEHGDHAVGVEVEVARGGGRPGGVGAHPVVRAVQRRWHLERVDQRRVLRVRLTAVVRDAELDLADADVVIGHVDRAETEAVQLRIGGHQWSF